MIIPANFEDSHSQVRALIADFLERESFYLSSDYQEAEARTDFIDKFWIALGWDVRHEHQKNPYEQEVKVERGVMVGLAQKKADYAFFLGNYRDPRFFCEAKKPSINIREDRDAHFQTHRYGWNSQTPLSVLMDFQEIVIVDCRRKPHIDVALAAAHRAYHYRDFDDAQKFGEIYWLFSREAVSTGKLDAYVAGLPRPKKTGKQLGLLRGGDARTVDASFLDDLEQYRADLARMLKNHNAELDGDALTELVQRILDRLVFLRFVEDKLIETEHRVHDFSKAAAGQSWTRFLAASRKLDVRYNGIVFKKHDLLDGGSLAVDDSDFADLCEELSHVRSPYDFNAIPVHILGSIYERFLGTVITTTEKRAKPELKPEVRKAGGVYYTPEYIVRYICEQTVGKLIAGKSPAQIEKLRFADIACGSGSFLLGVFDLLLRYHGRWYAKHPDTAKKENLAPATKNKKKRQDFIPAVVEREGLLCLTLEKKRQILVNNIYGVDLDPQAVEVAQLSLYLKLLEDETTASTRDDYLDFHEALLPPLGSNIKCGNSLVGTDVLFGQFEFSAHEERKLRPMDFESAFPQIFGPKGGGANRVREMDDDGSHVDVDFQLRREAADYAKRKPVKVEKPPALSRGFDAIVGNPPYVDLKGMHPVQVRYLFDHYASANNRVNLFAAFIEKALRICSSTSGRFSMIVPTSLLTQDSYKTLRRLVTDRRHIVSVCRLPNESFGEAAGDVKVDTMVVVLEPPIPNPEVEVISYSGYDRVSSIDPDTATIHIFIKQSNWSSDAECVWSLNLGTAEAKLLKKIETGAITLEQCAEFCLGLTPYDKYKGHTKVQIEQQVFHASSRKDKTYKKLLSGNDVRRYDVSWNGERWISYGPWLGAPREPRFFTAKRILVKQIMDWTTRRIWAAFTEDELYNTQNAFNLIARSGWAAEYLLALLNSKLMTFYHQKKFLDEFKMRFQKILIKDCRRFPIHPIESDEDALAHAKIVSLVSLMLATQRQISAANTDSDRTYLEDKCAGLDRQIDQLVYELYDLTPEEIALVEKERN